MGDAMGDATVVFPRIALHSISHHHLLLRPELVASTFSAWIKTPLLMLEVALIKHALSITHVTQTVWRRYIPMSHWGDRPYRWFNRFISNSRNGTSWERRGLGSLRSMTCALVLNSHLTIRSVLKLENSLRFIRDVSVCQLDCLNNTKKTRCQCGSKNCSGFIGVKVQL